MVKTMMIEDVVLDLVEERVDDEQELGFIAEHHERQEFTRRAQRPLDVVEFFNRFVPSNY